MYTVRLILAGFFMGVANLVPGVSGGTMILALGFYEKFIQAFSNLSRLKFHKDDIQFLAVVFGLSFFTILSLSTLIQFLMETFRPEMLALFIGLTLGGVPTLVKEIQDNGRGASYWLFLLLGVGIMAMIAFVFKPAALSHNMFVFFLGGIIGSSAMILPGISGSYLLLILGLYLPIISAISSFKAALVHFSMSSLWELSISILIPFALGMGVGILVLSNFLNFLLAKYQRATQVFLLGLLLGSVLGLYPFSDQTLDKLVRYQSVSNGQPVLNVHLYGSLNEDHQSYKNIERLESYDLNVNIMKRELLDAQAVEFAVRERAIILSYKTKISEEVRKKIRELKKQTTLVVLSDTSYSHSRLIWIFVLTLLGVGITYYIGTLKNKERT